MLSVYVPSCLSVYMARMDANEVERPNAHCFFILLLKKYVAWQREVYKMV